MSKYSYTVGWSDEDEAFIALCPEFPGLSAFGDTPEYALSEIQTAVDLAITTYVEEGWELPSPRRVSQYSGQFRLRIPKGMHGELAARAEAEGVSLNSYTSALIARGLGQNEIESHVVQTLASLSIAMRKLGGAVSALHSVHAQAANTTNYQDPLLRNLYGSVAQQTYTAVFENA